MEIKIKTIVLTLALILPMVGYAQEWLEKARKDAKYVPGTINGRTEEEIKTILLKADQGDAAAQFEMYQITKAKGEKSMANKYLQKAIAQNYIPALRASGNRKDIYKAMTMGDKDSYRELRNRLLFALLPKPKPTEEEYRNAAPYFERYAKEGKENRTAICIAFMYMRGKTGSVDSIKGLEWMNLAASWGSENAKQWLFERQKDRQITSIENVDTDIPKTDVINKNTFVVIFANESYDNKSIALHAVNDGRVMRMYFCNTLGIPAKNIQLVENATYNDMKQKLAWMSNIIEVFDNNVNFIFYFAGLGHVIKEDQSLQLLPIDGTFSNTEAIIPLNDVYNNMRNCRKGIVILDACFNHKDRSGKQLSNTRGVAVKQNLNASKGNIVTIAASNNAEGETAFSYDIKQHGMMTYHLLKLLQQTRGNITLGELSDKLIQEVKRGSLRINNYSQTPRVYTVIPQNIWRSWKLQN